MHTKQIPDGLYDAPGVLEILMPDERSRISLRYFKDLQARRLIPYKKLGRRVLFSPSEVRHALDRQFSVHAAS